MGRLKTVYGVGLLLVGLVIGLAPGAYSVHPAITSTATQAAVITTTVTATMTATLTVSPSSAAGRNNQVQVSGTVNEAENGTMLFFGNLNQTIETTAIVTNGQYSVLLVGGQSCEVFTLGFPPPAEWQYSDYTPFYVPLGVPALTENLVHIG